MEIDSVRDAWRLSSRHFSTYYNDKLRRESTNKVDQLSFELSFML